MQLKEIHISYWKDQIKFCGMILNYIIVCVFNPEWHFLIVGGEESAA
jgi:hypothetical protein